MNEANQNPDSQEFARSVLHNLAGLTAEVYEVKLLLVEVLATVRNTPAEKLVDHYEPLVIEETERLYREFLQRAKIPPGPNDAPIHPFPDRGASPPE